MNKKKQKIVKICLVGFMGAGKTCAAEILAAKIDGVWFDLDEFIAARESRTPAEIIENLGETVFREIETDSLREILESNFLIKKNCVIALGGGAWTIAENRRLVAENGFRAVWLDLDFETCWRRIKKSADVRPLAATKAKTRKLYEARRADYQTADKQIEISATQTAAEIAAAILQKIAKPVARRRRLD